jgi:pyruvate dehydrogenase E1 component alpha subunit
LEGNIVLETEIAPNGEGLGNVLDGMVPTSYLTRGSSHLAQVLAEDGSVISPAPELPADDLRSLYQWMVCLRAFDTRMVNLQRQGRIGFFVPSFGEEALQIGSAYALRSGDWVFPAYRELGVALFRGYPREAVICQLLGNREDFLQGRQMPNHFGSPQYRIAVASSPVGTQIPHAVGCAWSSRLRRETDIAVCYFGDGATSTGDFHAGLTFAGVQRLPVLFLCKNNGWAISLPTAKQTRAEFLADKAIGYGMPGVRVDGNDVLAVYHVVREAAEWARSGKGPILIEMVTQRMGPHSTADDPNRYRSAELLEPWKQRDPLVRMREYLRARGLWDDADEDRAWADAEAQTAEAVSQAEHAPSVSPDSMFDDVYAQLPWHLAEQRDEIREARG